MYNCGANLAMTGARFANGALTAMMSESQASRLSAGVVFGLGILFGEFDDGVVAFVNILLEPITVDVFFRHADAGGGRPP